MDLIFGWVSENWLSITEFAAAFLGLVGIILQVRQNHWYWLTSIAMVLLYIIVFYQSKFYADMSFQFYYLIVSIYGWYFWLKNKGSGTSEIKTIKLTTKQWILSLIVSAMFFVVIYLVLNNLTDSDIALGDAFTTSLSIVATWLLARKILENWIFWIVVDAVSTGLYLYKGLYFSSMLFLVLTIMAVYGYFKWRKALYV